MDKYKKKLWEQAIKWPLYSVVIIPILISAAFNLSNFLNLRIGNLLAFTIASILILFWENLTNDLFDSETGIDEFKFHSIVNLVKSKKIISLIAYLSLFVGLFIIYLISLSTSSSIIILVSFELSRRPSSKSNSHALFCFASSCLCSLFASFVIKSWKLVSC